MRNANFAMLVCALSSIATAQVTVVRAGRLVEPDSGTVLTDQVIVVDGGKIQAVGKGLAVPAGAKVIDLSDKTVLPGFIDCYTHLADGNVILNGDTFDAIKKTASQIVLESVPNAQKTLLSGFTTVRDVGTYRALNDIALRDAIARGDVIGPRMYVAGAPSGMSTSRLPTTRPEASYPLHIDQWQILIARVRFARCTSK
jgi:imidazolonepropionase-like amidohydrolase